MQRGIEVKISVNRAYGQVVRGRGGGVGGRAFSPRYDLDRWTGVITKPGHKLEGTSIVGQDLLFPDRQGRHRRRLGVLRHQVEEDRAKAFIFGVTNPVMVQGAVFAGIPITEGWSPHPREVVQTGDWVRVDPQNKRIEVLKRKRLERGREPA
jgi:predicted aconitase with swiveling domain